MAFWGIEVKPGKPFTHSFDRVRGRLRITQATLGIGSSTKTSLVQCNVGDKCPVFLCSLLPQKIESSHLELEFEEADEVVLSVIGPRSVHLTGYYVGIQHSNIDNDTDSYGEDIENTESEPSSYGSDEDDYDDSFIDDGDLEVFPSSPVSNDRVDEETPYEDDKKPKNRKGCHKRLRKKYKSIESDDDNSSRQHTTVNGSSGVPETEDEDKVPIASIFRSGTTAKNIIVEAEENFDKEAVDIGNKITGDYSTCVIESQGKANAMVIDDGPKSEVGLENRTKPKKKKKELAKEGKNHEADNVKHSNGFKEAEAQSDKSKTYNIGQDLLVSIGQHQKPASENELGPENGMKPKKKRKERSKEVKNIEANNGNDSDALKEDKAHHAKVEPDNGDQDLVARSKHNQKPTTNMGVDFSYDSRLPSTEVGSENGVKAKKRRKEWALEENLEGHNANCNNILKEDECKQDKVNADDISKGMPMRTLLGPMAASNKSIDMDPDQLADGCQSEEKKSKKKKKKSKIQDKEDLVNKGVPFLSKEEKCESIMEFEDKNADGKSLEVRTLSNGLIIEELETGKTDGKVAAPGKKVKIQYIGKLKENGKIFYSNIGKAPSKIRLGGKEVIEGWNVGIDGMRVGDKRRLTIPPSLGYGSQGAGENIPPNSWLVYDVQLVGIH